MNVSSCKVPKLTPNLHNKEKYVIHYRNLKQYLSMGMKLTKIHRVIEFQQKPWMREYINFNIEKRTVAKNDFEKDFFKLMNNAVFGKTMENLRKRTDVKLVNNIKKRNKLVSKPNYNSMKIFSENLVGINMNKIVLKLNRPIYCGMAILDISKTLMYDFHYNTILRKYGNRAKLLFTDTDSLCYEIKTDDIYEDIWSEKEKFDLSEYPHSSKFYDPTNKKVLGMFKDETKSKPIVEFVGLKAKMYSVKTTDSESKRAKGVKKAVIKKDIQHEKYKEILFKGGLMHVKMTTIRSDHHKLKTLTLNKIGLSAYDDKRYILSNGYDTLAYGYKKV